MNKEVISDKQGIFLMVMYLIGTSTTIIMGLEAKQDLWLAFILALFMALPIMFIYARLHFIFLGKDLFDILEICFGKFIGKGVILIYTLFVFHSGTLVLLNYGIFINMVAFPETPQIIPIIVIIFLCLWIVKEGIEVLGRWTEFFLPIFVGFVIIVIMLLIPEMDINNIHPILFNGIKPVFEGALSELSFPFLETIVFTMAISNFKRKKSSYKIYIFGLFIGWIILFVSSLAGLLVLGSDLIISTYYPFYSAITKINIGNLLQRLEILAAIIYSLGVIIKISIYLLATCRGVSKLFKYADYRFIVTPISLLMISLSYFIHGSVMYNFQWTSEIWPYYAFPFHVIIPIIIWITAEIKKKRLENKTIA